MAAKVQSINPQTRRQYRNAILGAALRSGVLGGIGVALLLVVYQLTLPEMVTGLLRVWLIPPAVAIIWMVTGMGAVMMTGSRVQNSREGGRVGIIAGLIAGTVSGVVAMIIGALQRLPFVPEPQRFVTQFTETQLTSMAAAGFTTELVGISGAVFFTLFVCGAGGMVAAALLAGLGGVLYPRFAR